MMSNHLPDFLVKQRCRIVLDTQHIGGWTGGHFKRKKFKQLPLVAFL